MQGKLLKPVKFLFNDKVIVASQSDTLLEALIKADIAIDHSCGGNATCGTCLVNVIEGKCGPPTELELEMAQDRGFSSSERLACQLVDFDGCVIKKGLV